MAERMSASVAAKHLGCRASANLKAAIPGWTPPPDDGETPSSVKGTNMHEIMELAGQYSPREMAALAEAMAYVAEVRQRRRFKVELEAKSTGWWLVSKPLTTADVVLWVADEIHVIDYKFGRIPVHAEGNEQGMYYALAFLPLATKAKGVHFHIVQPLANNIEEVFFTLKELEDFRLEMVQAENQILNGDVSFSPGDHCTFCPANPHGRGGRGAPACPAMTELLYPKPVLDEDSILDLV